MNSTQEILIQYGITSLCVSLVFLCDLCGKNCTMYPKKSYAMLVQFLPQRSRGTAERNSMRRLKKTHIKFFCKKRKKFGCVKISLIAKMMSLKQVAHAIVTGVSPSGKAAVFGTAMRRFESFHPKT